MDAQDPRRLLADRLRSLRDRVPPERKLTQPELAQALSDHKPLSVPLISSWESQTNPKIPPLARLEGYAALFAAPRSFEMDSPRILSRGEMTDEERQAVAELKQELIHLRNDALRTTASAAAAPQLDSVVESISRGPWRFADGHTITIVCAQWPRHMLEQMPYTDKSDPDYIDSLKYSELDALLELYGHLRATNPANQVNLRIAGTLTSDDYSSHLVSLGGVDWNTATSAALDSLQFPVRQIADWGEPDGQYFAVEENGKTVRHRPILDRTKVSSAAKDGAGQSARAAGEKGILVEDVALFARAISPFNRKRTVTICNGMYGRGTYGAVRATTDAGFRDRNAEYLRSRFRDDENYCILTRVRIAIADGATLTPDWTTGGYTLFEWSE